MRFLILLLLSLSCTRSPNPPPNILLILTDDMGYGDLGMAGNQHISTPNLDALSRAGTSFSNFYVSAVCAPTRASLLTGRYHQRTGVHSVTNGWETLGPEEITIAEVLQENGYETGIFGKWHLGEYYPSIPLGQGFNEFIGFRTGHTANYYDAVLERNGLPYETEGHITDVLTDEAIRFMQQDSLPFFCYLSFNAPHTPLQVDSSWFAHHLANGLEERTARVYGMVEQVDQQIGQLMNFLDASDKTKNTIVIFMSDNGPISGWKPAPEDLRYNAGLRDQKFTTYEGGIRTQSFWVWADKWKKQESDQVSAHIDVLPTLIEIIGGEKPDHIDGVSLADILSGKKVKIDRSFFQQYSLETLGTEESFPGGMIRQGPWKMINENELYNLDQDPGEQTNLAQSYPDTLAALQRVFQTWWSDILQSDDFHADPTLVGYNQENPIHIQPHHSTKIGQATYLGAKGLLGDRLSTHPSGVDGDWIANWQSQSDTLSWQIEIIDTLSSEIKISLRSPILQETNIHLYVDDKLYSKNLEIPPSNYWHEFTIASLDFDPGVYELRLSLGNSIGQPIELKDLIVKF